MVVTRCGVMVVTRFGVMVVNCDVCLPALFYPIPVQAVHIFHALFLVRTLLPVPA
jgi:hypothetical protein